MVRNIFSLVLVPFKGIVVLEFAHVPFSLVCSPCPLVSDLKSTRVEMVDWTDFLAGMGTL